VNGVLNFAYPVLSTVDGWLAVLLPAWLRLVVWGGVSAAAAMALYALMSNQGRLKALKRESAELRAAVRQTEDAGEAARLAIRNLKLSLRLLGVVVGPALLSGIPVLFVIAWVSATYAFAMPEPGQAVPFAVEPPGTTMSVTPAVEGEAQSVAWPEPPGRITLEDGNGTSFATPAEALSVGVVHKRRWWSWLLGNPAGYLPDAAAADSVSFALPRREALPLGPSWMRGWEFSYLVSLLVVSLAIKFGFRIV
jgi:hypothetical protein